MQFVRVAYGCQGNWFVGGDQQGNIYHFNIAANRRVCAGKYVSHYKVNAWLSKIRFRQIYRSGLSCTALVCCLHRPNEILAAFSDYTIRCLDVG